MANSTASRIRAPYGKGGRDVICPVAAATRLYEGTLVAQATATGGLQPFTAAGGGACIGMVTHDQDNTAGILGALRANVEYDRIFVVDNATAGDACSEALLIGAPLYGLDDHTVANNSATNTRQFAGTFAGMEPDGRVRLLVSATNVTLAAALLS